MMIEEVRALLQGIYEKAKPKMGNEMAGWTKVFQFDIPDGEPFYIEFSAGEMKIEGGKHSSPTATLIMEKSVLDKILKGELDAMAAFMRGMMKITGNVLETANLRRMLEAAKE
jgi:putative sterol carrier protein